MQPYRRSLATGIFYASIGLAAAAEPAFGQPASALSRIQIEAARLASQMMQLWKEERLLRGHGVDRKLDPTGSGLIGLRDSPVTSIRGNLIAKRSSVNPNLSAAIVAMFVQAGLGRDDTVAVCWTSSYPAMNICLSAAMEKMALQPICVASGSSSQYGANFPNMLWIDFERVLHERRLISFRSEAASIGGSGDRGLNLDLEGRKIIVASIERNGLPLLQPHSYRDAVDRRMQILNTASAGRPIKAYINVGGGSASVGRVAGKALYQPGLNLSPSRHALAIDSVMTRFARRGLPVIHLVEIDRLAASYTLPVPPRSFPDVREDQLVALHQEPGS